MTYRWPWAGHCQDLWQGRLYLTGVENLRTSISRLRSRFERMGSLDRTPSGFSKMIDMGWLLSRLVLCFVGPSQPPLW